jgi:hypothetical protein
MKCAYENFLTKNNNLNLKRKEFGENIDNDFQKHYSQKLDINKDKIVPKPLPIDDEGKIVANWLYSCLDIDEEGKLITDRVIVAIGNEEDTKEIKINKKTILTIKSTKED